jgi:hypothetical protein
MRCNNCGWDNPAENVRCEKCNAPMKVSDNISQKTARGCPECGYPLMSDNSTCPQCGYGNGGDATKLYQDKLPAGGTAMNVAGRKLVGFLVSYSMDANGSFFPLYEGRNFVGRNSASDICLQGDNRISGKHLSILYRAVDNKFKFRDEQSSYGTFVNEQLLDEGELINNDVIRIGSTKLILITIKN